MARRSEVSFSLFQKADAEGQLEKLSTGITSRFMGKTRVWCELYGTSFYIFRENKRASSESQMIDMKVVQMVRKVTSDKTGTQFEVSCKNKSQTFCAGNVEECEKWIRSLQHAMTLKDQENIQPLLDQGSSDYEVIDVFLPEDSSQGRQQQHLSTVSEADYAEIGYHNNPVDPQKIPPLVSQTASSPSEERSGAVGEKPSQEKPQKPPAVEQDQGEEYGYSSVHVSDKPLQKKPQKAPTVEQDQGEECGYSSVHVSDKLLQEKPQEPPTVEQDQGEECGYSQVSDTDKPLQEKPQEPPTEEQAQRDEYGYAQVQVRKKSIQEEQPPVLPSKGGDRTEAEGGEEDSYGYSKVQPRAEPADLMTNKVADATDKDSEPEMEQSRSPGDGAESGDDVEEDELYMEAMSRPDPSPIPRLPHPLTQGDTAPLKTVLEFLSENKQVCRWSYYDKKVTGDPVDNMKKFLQEISLG